MDGWVGGWFTLEGSLSWTLARRSPAVMIEPGERRWATVPDSEALRGMIIFIASTYWVGGWVGGWVEENEAVGMRCCELGMGGWVGRWVGRTYLDIGLTSLDLRPIILQVAHDLTGHIGTELRRVVDSREEDGDTVQGCRRVGGWVGGVGRGERGGSNELL